MYIYDMPYVLSISYIRLFADYVVDLRYCIRCLNGILTIHRNPSNIVKCRVKLGGVLLFKIQCNRGDPGIMCHLTSTWSTYFKYSSRVFQLLYYSYLIIVINITNKRFYDAK